MVFGVKSVTGATVFQSENNQSSGDVSNDNAIVDIWYDENTNALLCRRANGNEFDIKAPFIVSLIYDEVMHQLKSKLLNDTEDPNHVIFTAVPHSGE